MYWTTWMATKIIWLKSHTLLCIGTVKKYDLPRTRNTDREITLAEDSKLSFRYSSKAWSVRKSSLVTDSTCKRIHPILVTNFRITITFVKLTINTFANKSFRSYFRARIDRNVPNNLNLLNTLIDYGGVRLTSRRFRWPPGVKRSLRPLGCWDRGFKSRWGYGCLTLVLSSVGRGLCDGLIASLILCD
jgi:hypothetical protein